MSSIRFSAAIGLVVFAVSLSAQTPTPFSPDFLPDEIRNPIQVDLNNDGVPDFISAFSGNTASETLSAGELTYTQKSVGGTTPIVAGDFNKDGNADVFFYGQDGGSIGYGDGKGGFTMKPTPALPGLTLGQQNVVVGLAKDVNGDGREDLILAYTTGDNTDLAPLIVNVHLLLNNGGGFTDGGNAFSYALPLHEATGSPNYPYDLTPSLGLSLGDFDADGHADVALRVLSFMPGEYTASSSLYVLYGDGAGRFTPSAVFTNRQDEPIFTAADINGDGRTDLVAKDLESTESPGSDIHILLSNAGRTFSESVLSSSLLQNSVLDGGYDPPVVADFDGNHFKDIAFEAVSPDDPTHDGLRVVYQTPSHTWVLGPYNDIDQIFADKGQPAFSGMKRGDYNGDKKPDVILFLNYGASTHPNTAAVMLNTAPEGNGRRE